MSNKFRYLIALIALALIAAACGGDDDLDLSGGDAEVTETESTEPDAVETDTGSDEADVDDSDPDAQEPEADDTEPAPDTEPADDAEPPADTGADPDADTDTGAETEAAPAGSDDDSEDGLTIVSLSPTATEMLFAVDAGDLVVAVDEFSNFPPEAPISDLSGFTPNVEAIATFAPDVVFSQSPIEGLEAIGINNVVLPTATSFDDVYSQIEQIGAATGRVGEAAELVLQMQTDIDEIVAGLPEREAPLTYYHEISTTFFTATSQTFIGEVYSLLGLQNIADSVDADGQAGGFPQLSEEFIIGADPDIIFLADTIFEGQTAETVAARPGWGRFTAVQNGTVIETNDDIASRWGPRIVEFLQVAADAVATVEALEAAN